MNRVLALIIFILWMLIPHFSFAANCIPSKGLTIDPPTTNVDGSPVTDLAGFKIYYGNSSGTYNFNRDVGLVTNILYKDLTLATAQWFFVATAYDTSGNESAYSNEYSCFFDGITPNPPVIRPN